MSILGDTYIPLLIQNEVWRTADGGVFLLETMNAEHRGAVLALLERIAPILYADWVDDLLVDPFDARDRAAFGVAEPDPFTGRYARHEVLAWFEAQPLVQRLREMRLYDGGWAPRVLDLLGQDEIWRTGHGHAVSLEAMGVGDRDRLLRFLDDEAPSLFAEWLVEATDDELAAHGLPRRLDSEAETSARLDAHQWMARQSLVRRLRHLLAA